MFVRRTFFFYFEFLQNLLEKKILVKIPHQKEMSVRYLCVCVDFSQVSGSSFSIVASIEIVCFV